MFILFQHFNSTERDLFNSREGLNEDRNKNILDFYFQVFKEEFMFYLFYIFSPQLFALPQIIKKHHKNLDDEIFLSIIHENFFYATDFAFENLHKVIGFFTLKDYRFLKKKNIKQFFFCFFQKKSSCEFSWKI
jgi:hypothetical protein